MSRQPPTDFSKSPLATELIKNINVLDCTLRDGGLALQDLNLNHQQYDALSQNNASTVIDSLYESGINIIEVGSIDPSIQQPNDFFIYPNLEALSESYPKNHQVLAALYRGPDTPLNMIPSYDENLCQLIRVIIRYSELSKSLEFCQGLSEKGYKVFIQPMVTMRYSDSQIEQLIKSANLMQAYALYMVDSYGYMNPENISHLFKLIDSRLDKNIKIGFHAHNNMNLAFSNVQYFLNLESDRELIVDSTISGMGQGAGNMQSELLIPYLNEQFGTQYNFEKLLEACEYIEPLARFGRWGYSLDNLLPAIHKTAYKFSLDFRKNYKLNYNQINYILNHIPEDLRHRYTKQNARELLSMFAQEIKARELR